jgi:integrase
LIGKIKVEGRQLRDIRLAELRSTHIAAWRDARLRDVSGSSVSREMTLLSHPLDARREWGWLVHDPMKDVRRPPENPPRDRLIAETEIEKIITALGYQEACLALPSQRVAVAFLLAIETAMRSGEMLGLTSRSVDFERRCPSADDKNGGARNVPLSTRAVIAENAPGGRCRRRSALQSVGGPAGMRCSARPKKRPHCRPGHSTIRGTKRSRAWPGFAGRWIWPG